VPDKTSESCELCREYLREAGVAIRRHLRAVASLEATVRENNIDDLRPLADAIREAGMARENAVARYITHAGAHSMKTNSAAG